MIESKEAVAFLSELDRVLDAGADPAAAAVQLIAERFTHYQWVGVYWLRENMLVLGPFVGAATEHTHIEVGRGVCGTAVAQGKNQIVRDVRQVENYLACSVKTRSEIVVLIRRDGQVIGQLDADSDATDAFDASDEALLATVAERVAVRST